MAVTNVRRFGRLELALTISWAFLLLLVVALPFFWPAAERGDLLIRNTIRLSLLYYAAAMILMVQAGSEKPPAPAALDSLLRCCWSLAWLTYLVHLFMAFHFYHHWSHANAVAHTQEVSGFGPGIYFSHLFTCLWTADVALWWLRPTRRAERRPWLSWVLHGFMLGIIFCATVVYEEGLIRYAGLAFLIGLGALAYARSIRTL